MSMQQTLNFKVKKRLYQDLKNEDITKSTITATKTQQSKEEIVNTRSTPRKRPLELSRGDLCTTPTTTPTKSPSSSLTKFKTLEFTSPVKNSPSKRIRRSLCYDQLTTPTPPLTTAGPIRNLPLPYHYDLLEEKYHNVNVVLSMLEGRKEICTFNKLKKSVQEIMRKNFKENDIAQIKYLLPNTLLLKQERHIPGTTSKQDYNNYQLVIKSNVKRWSPAMFLQKRKEIHDKLLQEVIKHHKAFLSSLSITVPDKELYRWHVNFELQNVPDIPQADLPRPPINESYNSASDLLSQTEKQITSRVQTALERVVKKEKDMTTSLPSPSPLLKGVSPAIIERIRKKEAAKAAIEISRNPQTEQQLTMLARLPEMCRIIRSLFITERKAAIPWNDLLQKIKDSHTSLLDTDQIETHIECLLETIPQWCFVVKVKTSKYLKMKDKTLSQNDINKIIESKKSQLLS